MEFYEKRGLVFSQSGLESSAERFGHQCGSGVAAVLLRAKLPADLFTRKGAGLSTQEYFRLWRALEIVFDDPAFPLKITQGMSSEVFDPPIFSAYCSPDLNTALKRLSQFKPLIGPMKLDIEMNNDSTSLTIRFLETRHYITKTELPYTQISFLLGYEDPNSFFRAFHS